MNKVFKVGLIGCGHIAETYFRAHQYFNNIKIIKCADINLEAAKSCAKTYNIEAVSVKEVLEHINYIATDFGDYEYNQYIPKFDGIVGSILSMSFSVFAYVYVLTRASFFYQSHNLIEVSKNLGLSSKQSFFKVILPSARPAIVVALSLVSMEVLSDFGTVSFFSVSTLTTGIYNAWTAFDDLKTANLLSFVLLLFILVILSFIDLYIECNSVMVCINWFSKYSPNLDVLDTLLMYSLNNPFCSEFKLVYFLLKDSVKILKVSNLKSFSCFL